MCVLSPVPLSRVILRISINLEPDVYIRLLILHLSLEPDESPSRITPLSLFLITWRLLLLIVVYKQHITRAVLLVDEAAII